MSRWKEIDGKKLLAHPVEQFLRVLSVFSLVYFVYYSKIIYHRRKYAGNRVAVRFGGSSRSRCKLPPSTVLETSLFSNESCSSLVSRTISSTSSPRSLTSRSLARTCGHSSSGKHLAMNPSCFTASSLWPLVRVIRNLTPWLLWAPIGA